MKNELLHKDLTYKIIGCCMEVHKELGKGFGEIIYAEALEMEFNNEINYSREKKFTINYKGKMLSRHYRADFVIDNKIISEIKAVRELTSSHIKQTLNYLAASKLKIGLLINFGEDSLNYKRVIL